MVPILRVFVILSLLTLGRALCTCNDQPLAGRGPTDGRVCPGCNYTYYIPNNGYVYCDISHEFGQKVVQELFQNGTRVGGCGATKVCRARVRVDPQTPIEWKFSRETDQNKNAARARARPELDCESLTKTAPLGVCSFPPELNLEDDNEQNGALGPNCTYTYGIPANNGTSINMRFDGDVQVVLTQANVTLFAATDTSFFRDVPSLGLPAEIWITLHNPNPVNASKPVGRIEIVSTPTDAVGEEDVTAGDITLVIGALALAVAVVSFVIVAVALGSVGWKAWRNRWSRLRDQQSPEPRL